MPASSSTCSESSESASLRVHGDSPKGDSSKRQSESTFSRPACFFSPVLCVGRFRTFRQCSRLLPLGRSEGFAKRSLDGRWSSAERGEKHSAEPVKFCRPPALFSSFDQFFRLLD